ncbi:hypothetical protein QUC31_001422 [Theobroma cacao]
MPLSAAEQTQTQSPFLESETLNSTVDYKGRPAQKATSGGWRSASFLIAAEVAERFAYYGISSNLITYLTGPLGLSTSSAAENVNAWLGTDLLLPFIGAYVADSFLGHYRTIFISSIIYVLGLGLLTVSATLPSSNACSYPNANTVKSCSPSQLQVTVFFFSLYLIAIGLGGQKPCIEAFGADQFDGEDPEERNAKSSFFNWWFFGACAGVLVSLLILVYIQDNLSWGLGFGIPCICMILSLLLFLLGIPTYRYKIKRDEKKPFARIGRAFVAAIRNWRSTTSVVAIEEEACETLPALTTSQQFSADDIEEAKAALRLIPIWTSSLVFAIAIAQCPTFFTMQGKTMDRTVVPGFEIPAASLQALTSITILVFIPIYDRIFVPIARTFTGEPTGIKMLQRIGTGIFLSAICMIVAAVIETERLEIAKINGLVDEPNATVPMSMWWLVPQYMLLGAADVFTRVGLQEFFYDQISNELKSVGVALYLSVFGVGNFLSSILVSIVEKATEAKNGEFLSSWCPIASRRRNPTFTTQQQQRCTGCVDYNGSPVFRSNSGGWKSASFIIAVEVAERFAYYGIANNLITYLTGPLGLSMAVAAENVNAWSGVGSLLPLLGAFVADSFLGRYRTILLSSAIYILGLGLLTLAAMLPSLSTSGCLNTNSNTLCSTQNQVILFFFALYLVAVGQGGHKPCVQAFGADQFDKQDPKESKARSSFFNCGKRDEKSPFMRIGRVFVLAAKNWRATSSAMGVEEEEASGTLLHQSSKQFKFLNKALIVTDGSKDYGNICSIGDVEEAKAVLRLVPIWAASLVYAIVFAQSPTFFTKQGETMDRTITPNFSVPAASLQCFSSLGIVLSVPIYDRIFVPLARALTRNPAGITMLQRIGTGILLSALSMVISALVEMQRLKTAREYGLVDKPKAMVPMSVWWLVPQYALLGVSDVFTMVGLQEFFYDQVPDELRSVGLSLYLGIFGVGSFLSSLLVSTIEKATGGNGRDSWFADNLNRAHLDYFYWLLAGLSAVQLGAYLYFAKCYIYNRTRTL